MDRVISRNIYKSNICKYFVLQFDLSLGGDQPKDIPHIEHVLPQSRKKWTTKISEINHKKYLHTAANLLPLSKKMNQSISNEPYEIKKPNFKNDSMFKSSREFANKYNDWTIDEIMDRANKLAEWSISRWPDRV